MQKIAFYFSLLIVVLMSSCIKDDIIQDFVQPEIRITNQIDTLGVDSIFAFSAIYLNNIGQSETISSIAWTSSNESIVSVDQDGIARGVSEGNATITATYINDDQTVVADSKDITIGTAILPPSVSTGLRSKEGFIVTTSFYDLEGDFVFHEEENGVSIKIKENYKASSTLPGLYLYLSNNKNSVANALEIGAVTVFNGAHDYVIPDVGYEDYKFIVYFCKPFNVKVGEAEL